MIWTITVATFWGTVLIVVFAFLIFHQWKQIRAILRNPGTQRTEDRKPAKFVLELPSLDEPPVHQMTFTVNISSHGASAVTKEGWRPNDQVAVRVLRDDLRFRARIAYCKSLPGDEFAIGLHFSSAVDSWRGFPFL